jgi:hypothetical protein
MGKSGEGKILNIFTPTLHKKFEIYFSSIMLLFVKRQENAKDLYEQPDLHSL